MTKKRGSRKPTARSSKRTRTRVRHRPKIAPAGAHAAMAPRRTSDESLSRSAVIAVLNSNQDVLRLIHDVLQDEGYAVVTDHIHTFKDGDENLVDFLAKHRPALLLYDLAPPYQENWNFLQLLRRIPEVSSLPMVLTTVNKAALETIVGKTDAFEILGTHDNLAPVVEAINRALDSRR
jgi:CheY-like chemotaxis protein